MKLKLNTKNIKEDAICLVAGVLFYGIAVGGVIGVSYFLIWAFTKHTQVSLLSLMGILLLIIIVFYIIPFFIVVYEALRKRYIIEGKKKEAQKSK